MITKQDLVTFVHDLPDEYFRPGQEWRNAYLISRNLYTRCCGGVVVAALNHDSIEALGYDASSVDMDMLHALVGVIETHIDLDDLVIFALDDMEIPKKAKEENV